MANNSDVYKYCSSNFCTKQLIKKKHRRGIGRQATVGIAVRKSNGAEVVSINGNNQLPMQSLFKFHIALAVLNEVDCGKLSLDQKIKIIPSDLHLNTWSPIREKYPNGGVELSIAEILEYTVVQSDNNGCDILLRLISGTDSVERYLRKIGAKDVAIKANEEQMRQDWERQFLNWTTPNAATSLLVNFHNGKFLSATSRKFLYDIMLNTISGAKRLKGLLPQDTPVAHKTGTSGTNDQGLTSAVNDMGIISLPDGSSYAITVMVTHSKENNQTNEAIIAEISRLVWNDLVGKYNSAKKP